MAALGLGTAVTASASPGQVFAFGNNLYGQLGSTTNNKTEEPNPSPALLSLPGAVGPVVRLAAGEKFSLALTSSGQLYAFGQNTYGQLGNATNNNTNTPNPVPTLVTLPGAVGPVVQVAAGRHSGVALTASGQVYAFGRNRYGELGTTTNNTTDNPNPTPAPVSLPGASGPVVDVAAGASHTLALTSTGQLYAFGWNEYGQLGAAANKTANPTPALVTLPGATGPVAHIAGGGVHSLVVTSTGQLYSFGYNLYGQLGTPMNSGTTTPNPTPALVTLPAAVGPVVEVSGGFFHSLALTASGQLYAFGYNQFGELGNASNANPNPSPSPVELAGASGQIVQTIAGEHDSFAITSSGQLFAFGQNLYGQLGSATNSKTANPNPTPTLVSFPFGTTIDTVSRGPESEHTLALVAELAVLSGALPSGQVGVPYHASAQAAGGTGPYIWSASGLPAGLSINAAGQIAGTPAVAGATNVVLHASDLFGISATSAAIPLTIAPAPTVAIPPPPPPVAQGPTAAQIKNSLLAQLKANGKTAKISTLNKNKNYSYTFTALTAGVLTINWYYLPPGAHLSAKAKPKPVLVASGRLSFNAPGKKKLTIRLTEKGKTLLRHRQSIKLTIRGTFTPTGKKAITATKTVTLKR